MKKSIEKLLILRKTSKLDYLIDKYGINSVMQSPEYQKLSTSKHIQEKNSNDFIDAMLRKSNSQQSIKIITDSFLNNDEIINQINHDQYDYVFSLGGDGTFLRSISLVQRGNPTFIGVNTDRKRSTGHFCSLQVADDIKDKVSKLLNKEFKAKFINKMRIDFENREKKPIYFINDLFFGERFIGRVASYNLYFHKKEIMENICNNSHLYTTDEQQKILSYIDKLHKSFNETEWIEKSYKSTGVIMSTSKF